VKTNGIARVDYTFVNTWVQAAKNKMAAITKTKTALVDTKNIFMINTYVGSIFPVNQKSAATLQLMVPSTDNEHHAIIKYATVSTESAALMPLTITRRNMAGLMSTLVNRPYGWGGLYFYNDCSAELKSLFTAYGIWLPRHSSAQVNAGKMVDMSHYSKEERLSYLMQNGKSFLTIIYIGGHVVLYIGNYQNPDKPNENMAMTYQNMWGLSPRPAARRAVVGQSVFLPMLLQFPQDTSLISHADKKYFQVSYLDQLPDDNGAEQASEVKLRPLMYPETIE
jgi:cell wall-associated NlpC family hydrolase